MVKKIGFYVLIAVVATVLGVTLRGGFLTCPLVGGSHTETGAWLKKAGNTQLVGR